MNEIGGYFQLEDFIHNEYYSALIPLNTARNALVYLCRTRSIQKIWVPFFLCNSVSKVCEREGIYYDFYHIKSDFTPDFSSDLLENEYLYIVNYYGQLSNEQIIDYKNRYKRIILDNVQGFFEKPIEGIDTIYSCRKFFGVPDGAYLATDGPYLDFEADVSLERMGHLLGRYEGSDASSYYKDFVRTDDLFENLPLRSMSKLTHNLLGAIDYDLVCDKRNKNWQILNHALKDYNILKLRNPKGPYMYPFYSENGLELRKKLVEEKIYIPTLWPNVLDLTNCDLERDYARNILPLPIDQRYSEESLMKMVKVLMSLF